MKTKEYNPTMGVGHTLEIRKKLSVICSDRLRNNLATVMKMSKSGKRDDLGGQYFRSSWEANYARYLDSKKIKWEYEKKTFYFDGIKRGALSYTPDFKIFPEGNNDAYQWVELKGFLTSKDRTKIKRFKKQYPDEFKKLLFISDRTDNLANKDFQFFKKILDDEVERILSYRQLENDNKNIISNWEYSSGSSESQKHNRIAQKIIDKLTLEGWLLSIRRNLLARLAFDAFHLMMIKGKSSKFIYIALDKADVSKAKKKIKEWISLNGITNPPHSCEIWLWITKDQFTIFPIDNM